MQGQRPIAYHNHVLAPRARLKFIYEKELMAIVRAILKSKHYLMGRRFTIRTDQQSLKFHMEQREVGTKYQRWMAKLLGFDFTIQYKPETSNWVADALSPKAGHNLECQSLVTLGGIN